MEIICFHNPEEENGYLSNWYLSDFSIDGIKFSSMEQYMMYQKACCFHDEEIANKILHTDNVARIKQMVRIQLNLGYVNYLSIANEKNDNIKSEKDESFWIFCPIAKNREIYIPDRMWQQQVAFQNMDLAI